MEEMKKWQAGASYARNARDSAKKRLGSVVEVSSAKKSPSKTLDKKKSPSETQDKTSVPSEVRAQASPTSPLSLSSNNDKSGGSGSRLTSDKSGAEAEGSKTHQEEPEFQAKETREVKVVYVCFLLHFLTHIKIVNLRKDQWYLSVARS